MRAAFRDLIVRGALYVLRTHIQRGPKRGEDSGSSKETEQSMAIIKEQKDGSTASRRLAMKP